MRLVLALLLAPLLLAPLGASSAERYAVASGPWSSPTVSSTSGCGGATVDPLPTFRGTTPRTDYLSERLVRRLPAGMNGLDDDGDGRVDLRDPSCAVAWLDSEQPLRQSCGLGFEIAVPLGGIAWLGARRRRNRGS